MISVPPSNVRHLFVAVAAALLLAGAAAEAAELPTMRKPPPKPAKTCTVGGMQGTLTAGGVCVRISGYISGGVAVGNIKPDTK